MKKFLKILLFTILINIFPVHINGDVGPKPSVTINFENVPDGVYFVTLLSSKEVIGPWHKINDEDMSLLVNAELDAFKAFKEYAESDTYHFLNYVEQCNDDNTFSWSYYPPDDFKIAIYCDKDKSLKVSEPIKRYAFENFEK